VAFSFFSQFAFLISRNPNPRVFLTKAYSIGGFMLFWFFACVYFAQ